jgi:putative Mg2+ transporter-C (MgtC) family protein
MSFEPALVDISLRLGLAALLGAVIGLNRDLHDKPAGLKTHALVSLGAALIVLAGMRTSLPVDPTAITRTFQGIITGVGFIGAGVILRPIATEGVRGLTTASTIWVVACLGSACGAGEWPIAILAFTFVLAILVLGGPVERAFHRFALRHLKSPEQPSLVKRENDAPRLQQQP